jgi:phosphate/sulfate permease
VTYIAGLVVVGLLFLALHYFTEVSKSQKIVIMLVILFVVSGAIAFNIYGSIQREKMMSVVTKFNQGKMVMCEGVKIDKKNYTLSIGTYTFIGKEQTPNYAQMISASNCK